MHTIELHRDAPAKPQLGAACNGCGLCCALEPCPVAQVFLWQFRGACRALTWRQEARRYVCGMAAQPEEHLRWLPRAWHAWAGRFFASRIAAGSGCDCAAEVDA